MTHSRVFVAKRAMDIALSALLVTAAAPLIIVIAVAVKLTSKGPILFRRRRRSSLTGDREAGDLEVLKFRTMRMDEALGYDAFASAEVNRVTPVGRVLRVTRLDELPQIFTVLTGDASITGPPPARLKQAVTSTEKFPATANDPQNRTSFESATDG